MSAEWNAAIEAAEDKLRQRAKALQDRAKYIREMLPRDRLWQANEAASHAEASTQVAALIRALRRPEAARCDCGCQVHGIECDREAGK